MCHARHRETSSSRGPSRGWSPPSSGSWGRTNSLRYEVEGMTDDKTMRPRTMNALSAGVLLLAIALAIILYWATDDLLNAFAALLIVYGAYMAASSGLRKKEETGFGPSDADASVAGGVILAGIGITCIIWSYTGDVLPTVAALIIIVAAAGIALALKNRNVRS